MRAVRIAVAVMAFTGLTTACTDSSRHSSTESSSATTDASSSDSGAPGSGGPDSTSGGTDPSSTSSTAADNTLQWVPCTDPKATDPSLQCATVTVPLARTADGAPSGDATLDLALVRVPSTEDRKGSVLFNPGGPGGSGFDSIAQGGASISSSLGLGAYDLIGFDPRGVDRSNGIRCLTDAQLDQQAYLDDTPDTPEAQAALDGTDAAFAEACTAKYGDTLQDYSTANTARDMDAIREALGDETIGYLGISYGTYLGAVYATLFPDRIRGMVLDSAFEPSGDTIEQQYETQLVGFEHAFQNWATWCQTNTSCRFTSTDVGNGWDQLLAQLDAAPITNADGRIGNQVVMRAATIAALYSSAEWPVLGAALADAAAGDPAGLFRLADGYAGRDDAGHYTTIEQSNTVINCASGIEAESPPDPAALVERLHSLAPRFAADLDLSDLTAPSSCSLIMPARPIDQLHYAGDAPIVVIGGTNDPATPFRWAEEMTAAMGASATLVTYTGEGHGQLLVSKCVTEIEGALLAQGKRPAADTTCNPDPDIGRPSWWGSITVPAGIDGVLDSPELAGALGLTTTDVYSELRISSLAAKDVLAAYQPELVAAGFTHLGEQQPLSGSEQAVYTAINGDFFSILALDSSAFDDAQLASAKGLIPPGKTVVLLLYIPK